MNRDATILQKAKEIHLILWNLFEDFNGDIDAGFAAIELATAMYKHFGSPDGDNKGRTSAPLSKVEAYQG